MSLNIKNERVHDLARLAAQRTGTTQTGAIEAALEHYLAALDAANPSAELHSRIDFLLTDMRDRLDGTSLDTDVLYDASGLPA